MTYRRSASPSRSAGRKRLRHRAAAVPFAVVALASISGCGVGAGGPADGPRLRVTEDFGTVRGVEMDAPQVGRGDSVLRLLQRNAKVQTKSDGDSVQTIDGTSVGRRGSRPVDWFFYVNGVGSEQDATSVEVRDGDRVWWDHHDSGATQRIPAVVGSFPEPFRSGIGGERLPTRLECTEPDSDACDRASDRFAAADIVAGRGGLQRSLSLQTIRVLLGPWEGLRADETARQIEIGPQASGVYARMARDGRSLEVLDPAGEVVRTLGPGTGLVAATRFEDGRPVWVVTGTDDEGVMAAADALEEGVLAGKFALAIADGQAVGLPALKRRP